MKKRKLVITVHNNDNEVASQIKCNYKSLMSEEEILIEKEKEMAKKKKLIKNKHIVSRYNKVTFFYFVQTPQHQYMYNIYTYTVHESNTKFSRHQD